MLRRWVGSSYANTEFVMQALEKFVSLVEPVKGYRRGQLQKATQFTPLTRLADMAIPDSDEARGFANLVDRLLLSTTEHLNPRPNSVGTKYEDANLKILKDMLIEWASGAGHILGTDALAPSPLASESLPLLNDVAEISYTGGEALSFLETGNLPPLDWRAKCLERLEAAAKPKAAVELVIVQPIKELVIAAAEQEKRKTMPPEDWKKMIKEMAAPPKRR